MLGRYVIHRGLDHRRERAVFTVNEGSRCQGWIDPRKQVSKAVGVCLSRKLCIVSFAFGVQVAGYDVEIVQPVLGGPSIQYTFSHNGWLSPVYCLFGRSFALWQWENLKHLLRQVPQHRRLAVLDQTAQYYFERPWEQDIRLVVI